MTSRTADAAETSIEIRTIVTPAAIFIMLAIGLFETANNMHFTFAERIGVSFGLAHHRVGEILGIATLLGIPAAFAVVWLGDRYGELRPILASLAVAIAGLLLVLDGSGTVIYVTAMCALSVAWAFGLPYFLAFEAKLDPGGSVVVTGGFFTSAGAALGPALAAIFVAPNDYANVLLVAAGIYLAVGFLTLAATRFAATNRELPPAPGA